jgi:ABC-type branched-subunit amino acid transport system substrate-binding protein
MKGCAPPSIPRRPAAASAVRFLSALALAWGGAGCIGDQGVDRTGVAIGALVPFTGASAGGGVNYERATLLAVDYLNAQETATGVRFRMAVRDTHSTSERTLASLGALLHDENAVALIGPAQVELVQEVRRHLEGRVLAHTLPNSVTLSDFIADDAGLLVRPAPAAELMGCALANRIYGDGHKRLVVVHSSDAYRNAFSAAVVSAFESYRFAAHVGTGDTILLPDDTNGYIETVTAASALDPDALVVAADVSAGAAFVRAWTTLHQKPVRWFFDPATRSEEFLRNVSPSSIPGAAWISLALPQAADEFEQVFRARWHGDPPLVESYLYFDSVVSVGLAYLAAGRALGRTPLPEELAGHLLPVLRGPGSSVPWNSLQMAAGLLAEGRPMHYVGAAGRWAVDATGLAVAPAALFRFWVVEGGSIVGEKFGACPAGTIPSSSGQP